MPASSRALTIIALGDSTTAGTPGFHSPLEAPPYGEGDRTSQFAYWMMQARPAWLVHNRGVDGERSDQIAARLDRDVLAARPDALVLLAGVNDVYQGRDAAAVQAQLLAMYGRAADAGIPLVACAIVPYDTATAAQNAAMHAINAWIRDHAATTPGLVFCDTRAAVASQSDPNRLRDSPDGLHPSPAGYRAMGDALVVAIDALHLERGL